MPVKVNRTFAFVYGTLKRGERAAAMMESSDYFGPAETPPMFHMYGGSFPMIIRKDKGFCVRGELYKISDETFRNLDQYEGYPGFYKRMLVPIRMIHRPVGSPTPDAWVYFGEVPPVNMTKIEPDERNLLSWSNLSLDYDKKMPF